MSALEHGPSPVTSAIDVLRDFLSRPVDADLRRAVVHELAPLLVEPEDPDKYRGFDVFWQTYPLKIDKKGARKKWATLSIKDKRLAYRGLKNYLVYCEQTGQTGKFIKQPCTFLNGETWRDFQEKPKPEPPHRPAGVPAHAVPDGQGGWQY